MQGIFYISDLMKLYPNLSVSSIEFSFRYQIFIVTDTLLVIVFDIVWWAFVWMHFLQELHMLRFEKIRQTSMLIVFS